MDHNNHIHHVTAANQNLSLFERLEDTFSQYGFMPHGHCYLWKPLLVSMHVISDALIGIAYFTISITLYYLVKKIKLPFNRIVLCFGIFIGACGLTHLMEIWNLWNADYWWSAWVKVITAIASVGTGVYLFKLRHAIVQVAEAAKLAEERRLDLELLTEQLEKRVSERTEELEKAIIARDQFLSIASHELKTPLTTLKLVGQMREKKLKQHPGEDVSYDDAYAFYRSVNKQTARLTRLVDDMLDIARIQEGRLDLTLGIHDITEVVKEVSERFIPQVKEKGGDIHLALCESTFTQVDAFRIEQVLSNLFTNAIKYAPGTIVEVKVEKMNESEIQILVSDKGPGLANGHLELVFNRFERATSPNEVSGLGLGLYISRQIVESHGGKIWASANVTPGATFIISLPIIEN